MKTVVYRKGEPLPVLYDEADHHIFASRKWYINNYGYVVSFSKGKATLLHREILGVSSKMKVDHINGNGLDNRRDNIRVCTHSENMRNRKAWGSCKYLGVCKLKGKNKFLAQIQSNGIVINLGLFSFSEDAAKAYDMKAKELHGEFANLNFK